jgi:thiamine pyrophosphokinase
MKAALVGASDFNAQHFLQHRFDYVVAVDGGYAHLQDAGVQADAVVGDFDSLGFVPTGDGVHVYPSEKDESDLELACRTAVEAGCDALVLYGCLGQRFDHTLATMQVMLAQARDSRRVYAVGDEYALCVLHADGQHAAGLAFDTIPPDMLQSGLYQNRISVFAIGGTAYDVWEHGLKYELDGVEMSDSTSWGLSNEFIGTPAHVVVGRGSLAITFPLVAWDYLQVGV